jgi:hypothetical protein
MLAGEAIDLIIVRPPLAYAKCAPGNLVCFARSGRPTAASADWVGRQCA